MSFRVSRSIVGLMPPGGDGAESRSGDLFGDAEAEDGMPSRWASSSMTGVPSLLRDEGRPLDLASCASSTEVPDLRRVRKGCGLGEPCFKQSSKQSSQQGFPRMSTIGFLLMSLSHALQRKHIACHSLPAFSTGLPPSSFVRARIGL